MTATNLDRIAALEKTVAWLTAHLTDAEQRLAALEGAPPRRSPESTVACGATIHATPRQAPASAQAFGFTSPRMAPYGVRNDAEPLEPPGPCQEMPGPSASAEGRTAP